MCIRSILGIFLLLTNVAGLRGQQAQSSVPCLLKRPLCPDIGSNRELFVDYYLIDQLNGTHLNLHHPRPAEVVVKPDSPWETQHGIGQSVILHKGTYRLYYLANNKVCYAESRDGIR